MKAWKLDPDELHEDEPEHRDWLDDGAEAFYVHDLRGRDYLAVRDWLRDDTLRGSRKVVKQKYHDDGYGREVTDLTVLFLSLEDADRFEARWCDKDDAGNPGLLPLGGDIWLSFAF